MTPNSIGPGDRLTVSKRVEVLGARAVTLAPGDTLVVEGWFHGNVVVERLADGERVTLPRRLLVPR